MAAGRDYDVGFSKVSVSALQDLFLLKPGANMAIQILSVSLSPADGLTVTENLSIAIRRYASGFTGGSGGTSPTPKKRVNGDAAAVTTANCNNTTSTTGTVEDEIPDVWNEINGYQWMPIPETEMMIEPGAAFAVQLLTAPGAGRTVSGSVLFREIF